VWRFIAKQPKLSRDLATVGRIAELYRTTRQLPTLKGLLRTFVSNRADAGELRVIYRLLKHERVQTIRLLQPVRQPGARTPDLEVTLVGGTKIQGPLRVEITTVTGAAAGARTRAHTPAGAQEKTGGKPVEADRPATPEDVVEAVRRKLDRGQAAGGVIAVNVPFGTNPPLTRAHVDRIKQLWRTHRAAGGTVLEIWIVRPQTAQNPAPVSYVAGVGLGLTAPYRP